MCFNSVFCDVFDDDTIVLGNVAPSVEIYSPISEHRVRMDFEGLPYLGIWHMPHTQARYICVEPWSSLFSRSGVVEDLELQNDLLSLDPGKTITKKWVLSIQ